MANHTDGRESEHSKKIVSFTNVLKTKLPKNINVIFHDERFSSFEAAKSLELA
jgi:RNase H-fold protein (predicted Holliday junction resolvase)